MMIRDSGLLFWATLYVVLVIQTLTDELLSHFAYSKSRNRSVPKFRYKIDRPTCTSIVGLR